MAKRFNYLNYRGWCDTRVLHFIAALLYGALVVMTSIRAHAQTTEGPTPLGVDIPHIALLLPVDSSTFRRHGEALRDGFLAASKVPDPATMLIRIYPVGEDGKTAVTAYRQAAQTGARLVVGPLIRSAATAVAMGDVSVPTLVLNMPEGPASSRPNLYALGLQIETEARQAARHAYREGRRAALTIASESALLKRALNAFNEEFLKLGGHVTSEFLFNTSPAELERLKKAVDSKVADMAFLALDARQARGVRTTLTPLPLYATAQAYTGDINTAAVVDLAGIRVFDMPWLLQREHAAVAIYPRQGYSNDPDLERLYALGIDAWRIGQAMMAKHTEINIDGVTGDLKQGRDRQFTRELASVRLGDNLPVSAVGTVAPPPAPAPDKPIPVIKPVPRSDKAAGQSTSKSASKSPAPKQP